MSDHTCPGLNSFSAPPTTYATTDHQQFCGVVLPMQSGRGGQEQPGFKTPQQTARLVPMSGHVARPSAEKTPLRVAGIRCLVDLPSITGGNMTRMSLPTPTLQTQRTTQRQGKAQHTAFAPD